ncbi:unnamed protein product [Rotaria magnacalcarata]|uniref:Transposase n=1 Tax=Rotaria magnacalcarata TaxID=392030 RepID=A0A814T1P2_9BILA|nr:unnamed protein product [Rotaria magnacalcarata]CAF2094403.1 unnamed protein product [Rotaria magnacalcarata]CAF4378833.1 unnamed protein product [Rotaria magnacalcarata]
MLTKKEIEQLIDKRNSSLKIVKPKITSKSSAVWNSFNYIYVNDIKQEYVICNQCEDLLVYKPSCGTNSLSKHIRSCQKVKAVVSHDQPNINQFYASSKTEPAISNRVKQEIKVACVEFVALDCRSFKTIRGVGFKNLAQKIFDAAKYLPISKDINIEKLLPHPTTISRDVNKLYNKKHQQLISICEKLLVYTVVVDFWKNTHTGIQYCGISLHHISDDWKLHCFVLGCCHYDLESNSAINTRKFVESKLSEYRLELNGNVYIVSDNEPKMLATFKLNCQRIGCSCHFINKQLEHTFTKKEIDKSPVQCDLAQVLFERVKKIVSHVRRSHKQTKLSKRAQTYSETRFNGAYHMLQVFLDIFDELILVLDNINLNEYLLLDKEFLEQVCSFLKVFDDVIEQLSEDKRPTIYKVLPLRQRLLNECEMKSNDSDGLKEIKVFLSRRLKTVWVLQDVHYISCLLHPSLKQFQIAPDEKSKALDLVNAELLKRQSATSTGSSIINITPCSSTKSSSTSKSQNILLECFDHPAEDEEPVLVSLPDKELTEYLFLNVTLEPDADVLLFWKQHQNKFPTLASIVKDIYSIPASNTTVERLFSSAGSTISDRRTNLDSEKVNKLLFLNKNLLTLKELDRQQLLNMHEKRKLDQTLLPLSPTSSSNVDDNDNDYDEEELSFSSSKPKKARTFDDDQFSDDEIMDKHSEVIDEQEY